MNLDRPRVLVLNAGYEALSLASVKRAVLLVMAEKAEVVEQSSDVLRTPSMLYPIPSIIRLNSMIRRPIGRLAFNRQNVLKRDGFCCQYCGAKTNLTLDHVLPKSRGGASVWENMVTACHDCNAHKRDRTPEEARMPLFKKPVAPRSSFLLIADRNLPESWRAFIPEASLKTPS